MIQKKIIVNRDNHVLNTYFKEINKINILDPDEEVRLVQKIREGDTIALEQLVKSNLRFVVSIANQFQNQNVSLNDLINEGNIGLIKAAKRFDASQGFRFLTYAGWWIRRYVSNAIEEQSRIVHLPFDRVVGLNKIKRAISELEKKLEREPSTDEIAKSLQLTPEKVEDLIKDSGACVSLYYTCPNENSTALIDRYPCNYPPTDHALIDESVSRNIKVYLSILQEREREVLEMYFGLGNRDPLTIEEISLKFSLTRERIRQLKEKAIRQLYENKAIRRYLMIG